MITIIANGFGILSTICFVVSFQVKSNKGLYIIQSVANVFYGLQFLLLGAFGGLFNMAMQIVRNLLICKKSDWKWLQHPAAAPLLCLPSLIWMIGTWSGPQDLLPFIAMAVGTFGYWTDDAKKLRIAEMTGVSPAWLAYDLLAGAHGGVINEAVILGSVLFSILRLKGRNNQLQDGNQPALETAEGRIELCQA
ncbi:MAG: YgjV family protein [Firmicutes bacterium]|nr:YgjV family protein [Bacillota bacterium]